VSTPSDEFKNDFMGYAPFWGIWPGISAAYLLL